MFTWICPQCGREVPPSYNECPDCAAKAAGGSPDQPEPPVAAAPTPPRAEPVPPPAAQARPGEAQPLQNAPVPPPAPVRSHGAMVPTWLMAVLFAFAFVGLGAGIYWTVGYFRGRSQAAAPAPSLESPAAKPGASVNPLQKYIEISGVRFTEEVKNKGKVITKFIITNHSQADITGLAGNVTVWGRTQKSEEDAQGTFSFTTNLGPFESKELSEPLTTKLKIYELPDWQNVTTDVQITGPQ